MGYKDRAICGQKFYFLFTSFNLKISRNEEKSQRYLTEEVQRHGLRKLLLLIDEVIQVHAVFEPLHDVDEGVVSLVEFEQLDNTRHVLDIQQVPELRRHLLSSTRVPGYHT